MRAAGLARLGVVTALCLAGLGACRQAGEAGALAAKLAQIQPGASADEVPCADWRALEPLLIVVMGQSNAANHGEPDPIAADSPKIRVLHAGHCYLGRAPLPGATGRGGSLWPALELELNARSTPAVRQRTRIYVLIAVDGTRIDEWSRDTVLRAYWRAQLRAVLDAGWQPALLLWQQGEADARAGTPASAYIDSFLLLRGALAEAGLGRVPLLAARSSYCADNDGVKGAQIQQAWLSLSQQPALLLPGPDTDSLRGADRFGPCHFSAGGLRHAAGLWADTLMPLLPPARQ